jgi:hypothetical protein
VYDKSYAVECQSGNILLPDWHSSAELLSYKNGDPTLYGINYNHATTMIADMCGFCSEPRLMGW